MLFSSFQPLDKKGLQDDALRSMQCSACPLEKFKRPETTDLRTAVKNSLPVDILVVTEKTHLTVSEQATGYSTRHVFLTECSGLTQRADTKDEAAIKCCSGRKGTLIELQNPKLVIAAGFEVFKALEALFGNSTDGIPESYPMPTSYKGHDFWLLFTDGYDIQEDVQKALPYIRQAMNSTPKPEKGSLDGIELVMTSNQIAAAFTDLGKSNAVAFDIETNALRPYGKDSKLLSVALSNGDKTFAFPLGHSQTPGDLRSAVRQALVLNEMTDLFKRTPGIAHNLPFELEWLVRKLGSKFAYASQWEDTIAQAYLLSKGPKTLDALIRKFFGFHLKKLSQIDVENLENTPIEQVLTYNGLDSKYTYKLWERQRELINDWKLDKIYRRQVDRVATLSVMQNKGMMPDEDFIDRETQAMSDRMDAIVKGFEQIDAVKQCIQRVGHCSIRSNDDIKRLFHTFIGVPSSITSFDEEFLSTQTHPAAKLILDYREIQKMHGYLAPLNRKADHKNAGKNLHDDGLIHPVFKPTRTLTGRLSSSDPNAQNFPSRGGWKYLRNVVKAPKNYIMVAIDFGQIEYRVIAALSKDKEMIHAINNDMDVHMFWAKRLVEIFPNKFVFPNNKPCIKDPDHPEIRCDCNKCQLKAFRSETKNCWTFPLCFGSSPTSVLGNLKLSSSQLGRLTDVVDEFWQKHHGVRSWQNQLQVELRNNGYVMNAFGRKYWAPLSYNEMINYPIQGTASDVVVTAMDKLGRLAHELDEPDLCPIINIHDDLTFCIREDKLEELLPIILATMLDTSEYHWLPVPLTVEVSTGYSWGSLEEFGTFSSLDF